MPHALTLEGISKSFAEVRAVQDLNLGVEAGSVFGLLGPNGAGKSTTIRMIMDIIKPDHGVIRLLGEADPEKRRDNTGYLPEERGLYRKTKVRELLVYFGRLHDVDGRRARTLADSWLQRFELSEWADRKIEALSKGMQQKVQLIATILHQPKVLILDEPFSGLDPVNVDLVRSVMLELRDQGTTILLSTHQMETVEKLCDSICLINHGRAVLSGSLQKIKAERGTRAIQIEYEGHPSFQRDSSLVARVEDSGRFMELYPADGKSPQQILQAAMRDVKIHRFEVMEPSLHQIFVETVRARGEEVQV
jgi:ABC-2 type transport system ATP-binding protein